LQKWSNTAHFTNHHQLWGVVTHTRSIQFLWNFE